MLVAIEVKTNAPQMAMRKNCEKHWTISCFLTAIILLTSCDQPITTTGNEDGPIQIDKLVTIPGGTFIMGDTGNAPAHQVTVSSFMMSNTECSQGEYVRVMGVNPSYFQYPDYPNLPVEKVSWFDAVRYCIKRSLDEGKPSCYDTLTDSTNWTCNIEIKGYRLPTEAEWEYACRGGTTGKYYFPDSDTLDNAWIVTNSWNTTHPVATKRKNALGLYT